MTAPENNDILISCENVSKKFCRDLKRSLWYGVKDICADLTNTRELKQNVEQKLRKDEFWALKDVSFELRRGECLGLVGRNGAGKTTLLKMLNGLIKPDTGRVRIASNVGALIALGAGFNPILTGRENIFVNGVVLGLSQAEIRSKLDEVVDFAEIGAFIDTPVQNYSSGMKVRLGFATAAVLIQPDVLLLDEVLAVGDMGFTIKCMNRIREIASRCAVVLISHSQQNIGSFCTKALVLEGGHVSLATDSVPSALAHYARIFTQEKCVLTHSTPGVEISDITLSENTLTQYPAHASDPGKFPRLEFNVVLSADTPPTTAMVVVRNLSGEPVLHSPCVDADDRPLGLPQGASRLSVFLPVTDLNSGDYKLHILLGDFQSNTVLLRMDNIATFRVNSDSQRWGRITRNSRAHILA